MKNRILLEHYNDHRYYESLSNLMPADVYLGRGEAVLRRRATIKRRTLEITVEGGNLALETGDGGGDIPGVCVRRVLALTFFEKKSY